MNQSNIRLRQHKCRYIVFYIIIQLNLLQWPPLLSNNLYYVILILIQLHSAFHINKNLYLATTCLMWPYFSVALEGCIRQVLLYLWSHIYKFRIPPFLSNWFLCTNAMIIKKNWGLHFFLLIICIYFFSWNTFYP